MKQLTALFITIAQLAINHCMAQESQTPAGASFIGLGAYSQQFNDVFAQHSSTAALGMQKKIAAGVFGERRFMLNEMNSYLLAATVPTGSGTFGLMVSRFGFSGFNETEAGLGYGRLLAKKLAVGGRINYFNRQVPGYGSVAVVNGEAGILLYVTPKCAAGAHVYNPVAATFGMEKEERLASVYRFGLGYDVSKAVFLVMEIRKKENEPVTITSAVQYHFEEKFFARLGITSGAPGVFAGAGWLIGKQFRLTVFTAHRRPLGFTPGITLQYSSHK